MVERARSHQIDKRACKIFDALVPDGWVAREQHPDYAVDFRVEIYEPKDPRACGDLFEPTYPTGELFAVQVKGSADPKGNDEDVTYALKVDHLAYYVDKEPQPVFLVVIDTITEDAYWIFIQEYADEHLADVEWRAQETITVRLPRSNLLKFDARFRQIVKDAIGYVAARGAMSVNGAIVASQRHLERIDPRFSVKISAEEGQVKRQFTLRQHASVDCSYDFGDDEERREEFLLGKTVPYSPGEIHVDTPLFERALREGGTIRLGGSVPATVLISDVKRSKKVLALSGTMTRGMAGGSFETQPGPIQFRYSFLFDGETARAKASIYLDLTRWYDRPILELDRFDEIDALLGSGNLQKVSALWLVNGQQGEPGTMRMPEIPSSLRDLLVGLRKAREVARAIGVVPTFPRNFGEIHKRSVELLHALLFKKQCQRISPSHVTRFTLAKNSVLEAELRAPYHTVSMKGVFPNDFDFLGCRVDLVMSEMTFEWATVECRDLSGDDGEPLMEVLFSATKKSRVLYRSTGEVLRADDPGPRLGMCPERPIEIMIKFRIPGN